MYRISPRKIVAFGALAFSLVFTGCLTDDKGQESDGPVITTNPTDQTVMAGSNATFTVVASGSGPVTYQWMKNGANIEGATNATLNYQAGSGDDDASFTVKVTDKSGSTTSAPAYLRLALTSQNIILGAQDNATGSFLDLDNWTRYTVSTAPAQQNNIDLVFAFSTADTAAALYSPDVAKNGTNGSNGFTFMNTWTAANTTPIKVVTVADFGAVQSASAIKNLFDNGQNPPTTGKVRIESGTTIVAKSNGGLYVLIRVTGVTQSASGVANLTGKAKW